MCHNVYKSISRDSPENYPLQENDLQFETVSGEVITSLGTVMLDLKVGNRIFSQKIIVADIPQTGILGIDFFDKYKAQIDFQKQIMKIEGKSFTLITETRKFCCRVSLVDQTYIPPNSEILTFGKMKFRGDWFPEGQVEPLGTFQYKNCPVLMGRTLVKTRVNKIPIKFINLSDEPCVLPGGMGVGLIQPVKLCQPVDTDNNQNSDPLLQKLIDETCVNLDESQSIQVENLLDTYSDVFMSENGSLGRTDILQHEIDTGDIPPIKLRPYRLPIFKRQEIDRQVDEMLKQRVISPSSSP